MKRALPFIIIIVVLVAAVAVAWSLKRSATQSTDMAVNPASGDATAKMAGTSNPGSTTPASGSAPTRATNAHPGAEPPHSLGPADAPVTIEEFGDFQCPPCGMFHPILQKMEHEFGSKLRVIFREYPLVPAHAHALSAARAAEAAGLQGKFWQMHGMIFDNQKAWKDAFDVRPIFEGYAQKIGLDVEQYRRDAASQIVEQRIFLDGKRAHSLGVSGTPTVYMNGREVPFESLAEDKLRLVIQNELNTLGK